MKALLARSREWGDEAVCRMWGVKAMRYFLFVPTPPVKWPDSAPLREYSGSYLNRRKFSGVIATRSEYVCRGSSCPPGLVWDDETSNGGLIVASILW